MPPASDSAEATDASAAIHALSGWRGRSAEVPPSDTLLCETCGYRLDGLGHLPGTSDADVRCPECGTPVAESDPSRRGPTLWDRDATFGAFLTTTAAVLLTPRAFYRGLAVRGYPRPALTFGRTHCFLAAWLLSAAVWVHASVSILPTMASTMIRTLGVALTLAAFGLLTPVVTAPILYLILAWTTLVAARLTAWEARYRGLRLPLRVVLRTMHYHTAQYLPVAIGAAAVTFGFAIAWGHQWVEAAALTTYLYVLSGYVVVAAIYLFVTYWAAMKGTMYANG